MGNQQASARSRKSRSAPNSARGSSRTRNSEPLTPYQATALKETWHKMCKSGRNSFGSLAFKKTIEEPTVRKMCQQVDVIEGAFSFGLTGASCQFHEHSVSVNKLVELAVSNGDNLMYSDFIKECEEIGAQHSQFSVYGFKSEFWDVFGNCAMETAMSQCRGKCVQEKRKAWAVLASIMADRMRAGYETSMRRRSVEPLATLPQRMSKKSSAENLGDSLSIIAEVPSRRPSTANPDPTEESSSPVDPRATATIIGTTDSNRIQNHADIQQSDSTITTTDRPHYVLDRNEQNANRAKALHTVSNPLPDECSVCSISGFSDDRPPKLRTIGSNEQLDSLSCDEQTPDLRRKAMRRISLRGLERANKFRQKAKAGRRMTTAGILDSTDTGGSTVSTRHILASTDQSTGQSLSREA